MTYKKCYVPNHPYAMKCGCVYEHRLIMEALMGRHLLPHEQVHHKDGDPSNNEVSNLVFCPSQREHSAEHAYGDDLLIERLIRYSDVYGYLPTKRECDAHSQLPHSSTYIRRFGSWREALHIARRQLEIANEEWAI